MTEPTEPIAPPEATPAWNAASAAPAATGPSGWLVTAAVIMFVMAVLIGLFSLVFVFVGAVMNNLSSFYTQSGLSATQTDAALGLARVFLIIFGGIGVVLAAAHLLSGIGILRRRGWARILGLVVGVLGVLIWAIALVANIAAALAPIPAGYLQGSGFTLEEYRSFARIGWIIGISVCSVGLAGYLVVVVALARRGREFR